MLRRSGCKAKRKGTVTLEVHEVRNSSVSTDGRPMEDVMEVEEMRIFK